MQMSTMIVMMKPSAPVSMLVPLKTSERSILEPPHEWGNVKESIYKFLVFTQK